MLELGGTHFASLSLCFPSVKWAETVWPTELGVGSHEVLGHARHVTPDEWWLLYITPQALST